MSLKVLKVCGSASLQGCPQTGRRHFGVPAGGAFDLESLALGNALVGNPPESLALELTLIGGRFVANAPMTLSLVGAEGPITVSDRRVMPQSRFQILRGDRLEIGAFELGVRAYLCVSGGWQGETGKNVGIESELCSRHLNVPLLGSATLASRPSSLSGSTLRFIPESHISPMLLQQAQAREAAAELDSDRRGVRLSGFPPPPLEERASEPVVPGTIQWTPGGGLLILGPDGPTIGGYRRLGVVCSPDLCRVGQLGVGRPVALSPVSIEEARANATAWRARLEAGCRMLRLGAK